MFSPILIDLHWLGHSRSIASALLRSEKWNALIDPGPSRCLATLRQQLGLQGLGVSDLHFIFLTHIHLDHAGATGALLQENPDIQVYVHERGAPHMIDPEVLTKSAHRLYRDQMNTLFGEFLPVPLGNLQVLRGGETVKLGTDTLQVHYTPGHASHHVSYFEPESGIAFVGDTTGIAIEGHPFVLPATPPPDIDLTIWDSSLETIERLHPRKLFLTHFGYSSEPTKHLASHRARLHRWSDLVAQLLGSGQEDAVAMQQFVDQVSEEIFAVVTREEAAHYSYNGYLPLSWMGLARYHRKRAKAAAQPSATNQ